LKNCPTKQRSFANLRGEKMNTNANLPRTWQDFLSGQKFFPAVVKSIERIHDRTWEMQPNIHDHFELVYVKKGNIIYKVGESEVPLNRFDLILIKPNQRHVVTVCSQEMCELFVLSFSFERKNNHSINYLSEFMDFVDIDKEMRYIRLHLTRKNDFTGIFHKIVREQKNLLWNDIMINLLMMELFVFLSREIKNEREQGAKSSSFKIDELLTTAKKFIDTNYNKEITLRDMAAHIAFSESYFTHSFKQKFGISPKSYLLKVRIESAKEYLENTDMKIGDIALTVGFSGQQRFNDIFKKSENITPLKYRNKTRLKKLNVEK